MRSPALIVTALLALAAGAGAIPTRAAQIVWSGLVIAENVPEPSPIPAELSGIEQTLKELFGYNQFQVIGQSLKTLRTGEEDWLASSKYFALHVDAQGESESGYTVNLKLYKEKELLLETDTKLSKQSPLVIKGPFVGNGQLLLVLMVESGTKTGQHRAHRESNQLVTAWRHFSHAIRDLLP
jgi:hypothetical protein